MFMLILQATPVRIWFLLAGLVALGLAQARPRTIGARRAAVLPVALLALSLGGVVSSFGFAAMAGAAWLSGIAAALLAAHAWLPRPDVRWSDSRERVHVAGSWLPLTAIVALFATKYAAGVALAMQPGLALSAGFAAPYSFAFGFFSGVLAARGLQMWHSRRAAG